MPSSSSCATCSGLRRSARMPACTAGCSVFTRPSRHSGNPVTCSTGVTGTPASAIRRAVAPVLTSSTPAAARPRRQLLDAGLVVDAQQGTADRGCGRSSVALPRHVGGAPARATVCTRSSRSTSLIRSCSRASSSPGRTATSRWASTGPVSTPASTTCTRRTRHGRAGGQGVADGVRSRERRQQGRVGVDQPAAERVEHGRADDLHEAGRDDQVGLVRRRVRRPARGPRRRGRRGRPTAQTNVGRPLRRACSRPVGVAVAADGDHGRRVVRIVGRGEQGGAERPGPGEQDDDPGPRGGLALARRPRPAFRP